MNTVIAPSGSLQPYSQSPLAAALASNGTPGGSVPRAEMLADTVQISGRALLHNRLFPGTTAATAPVSTGNGQESGSIYTFLTGSDRDMLASLYAKGVASAHDLRQIDALAFDLANYRSSPARGDKVGTTFDEDGNPVRYAFTPTDEATAQRILTSTAMKDTGIPTDFLKHLLDPGFAPADHAVDFGDLERLVYAASLTGADGATDPSATLAPRPDERLATLRASGRLPDPPDLGADTSVLTPQSIPATPASRNSDVIAALLDGPQVQDPAARVRTNRTDRPNEGPEPDRRTDDGRSTNPAAGAGDDARSDRPHGARNVSHWLIVPTTVASLDLSL